MMLCIFIMRCVNFLLYYCNIQHNSTIPASRERERENDAVNRLICALK